jgi:hypothetical protein
MSHTIASSGHVPQTDAKVLPFVVRYESGDRIDLTGADIVWELRERAPYDPALSLDDSGVSIVDRVNSEGEFSIRLETDATADLEPLRYRERVRITDSNGDQTTWIGEVPIVEDS